MYASRWMMAAMLWAPAAAMAAAGDPSQATPPPLGPSVREGSTASSSVEKTLKRSAGQNMFGGRLGTAPQIILSTGFPHGFAADFRLPVGAVELAPHLYFDYGNPFGANIDLGTGVGIGARIHLWGSGGWDVALRFDTAFDLRFHHNDDLRFNVSLLDPGVRVSYNVDDLFDIDVGLDVLPQLRFDTRSDPGFGVAIPLVFGIEGDVAPGIQVGFTGRGGPAIGFGDLHDAFPTVKDARQSFRPYIEALLHVGFSLGNGKKARR